MSRSDLIVGTLYPDGEMIRQEDGIGFVCPNPILCFIERVDTLAELKSFILRTMGVLGRKSVRRVAYRLLNILPPLEYKFKIFWLEGDVHVRAMFDLHRRYGPRQEDGIGFVCPNPILCFIERVDTLAELKSFILRTMGVLGRKSVQWVAYRLLNILPPQEYKFKIFWLEGDVHVRAMFDLHRRYGPRQVMELLYETRDVIRSEAGPSSAIPTSVVPIAAAPLRVATPNVSVDMDSGSGEGSDGEYMGETDESSDSFDEAEFVDETQVGRRFLLPAPVPISDMASVSSHFHTLNLDAMEEEPREGHGGGGDDYLNLDGGEEFRVGHRFSCREAV
ncbi:hypothetical protein PIB30_071625 [Stylosanthes scabra]|uniref:Uncharacterized protein n=1 Tax=Stylosanthes scabra TaxID=79078 RepID=A0ABU6RP60_9FABA|nr:hypothetical protein [Stylosanthes scabra]